MARTKKNAVEAPGAVQGVQEVQTAPQDIQERELPQEAPEAVREGAVTREVIGPDSLEDLAGCQDEDVDGAELMDGLLVEYAVTAEGGLRLRERPSTDAPILATLPCGAGVLADGSPEGGWLFVRTGRLEGWMMAEFLEALSWPELAAYAAE